MTQKVFPAVAAFRTDMEKVRTLVRTAEPLQSTYKLDIIYTLLRFEWDESKNKHNRAKHRVWFEEAQGVFFDSERSAEEDRFVILGMSGAARLLVVVHCHRQADSVVRIISARKATRKEARTYEEGI